MLVTKLYGNSRYICRLFERLEIKRAITTFFRAFHVQEDDRATVLIEEIQFSYEQEEKRNRVVQCSRGNGNSSKKTSALLRPRHSCCLGIVNDRLKREYSLEVYRR